MAIMCNVQKLKYSILCLISLLVIACNPPAKKTEVAEAGLQTAYPGGEDAKSKSLPLVTHMYTADPSAHVFEGKLYIYPSHDIETENHFNDDGGMFAMEDYHVLSMDKIGGEVTDHGEALHMKDVSWAGRQMWAPDAAEKDGTYYLYFPVKDKQDIFRIGVATADNPAGPFIPQQSPISGTYSIDPTVFKDKDGEHYIYLGGIWGGQLQRWQTGTYLEEDRYPADDQPAIQPKVAKLAPNMTQLAEPLRKIQILDENGNLLTTGDNHRRFFEGSWMHYDNDRYYFSYSTGDTHKIVYATGNSPYGPFTYQGVILEPVEGWTSHHSIVNYQGKNYLFYHDSKLSGGKTHLRAVKVMELQYDHDGKIITQSAYKE